VAQLCPKCGKESPDDAYFCDHCHAHIRSAFGGTPVQLASSVGTLKAPAPVESIFSTNSLAVAEPPAYVPQPPPSLVPAATQADAQRTESRTATADADDEDAVPIPGGQPQFMRMLEQAVDSLQTTHNAEPLPPVMAVTEGVVVPVGADAIESAELSALLEREAQRRVQQRLQVGQSVTVLPPDLIPPSNTPASNTSGMKEHAVLPAEAKGWSYAGFIPFGAFGFGMGFGALGIVGFLGTVLGWFGLLVWIGYIVACGVKGREYAWRQRKFVSIEQYTKSLELWDSAGKVFMVLDGIYLLIAWAVSASLN
jgi:hypothetical protein